MIKFQLVSDISGRWDVDYMPNGWIQGIHPDYDGAEDGCLTTVIGKTLDDLMHEVKEYDLENEHEEE